MGTLAFVDHGIRADACIMAEPTDMKIAPLCRGILWGRLVLAGRSGHIELPRGDWRSGGAVDAIQHARLYPDPSIGSIVTGLFARCIPTSRFPARSSRPSSGPETIHVLRGLSRDHV